VADAARLRDRDAAARWQERLKGWFAFGREVGACTLRDGYIHAGNLAYLSLVTLMPFVILLTAVTAAFGQTEAGQAAIGGFLRAMPPDIARLFEPVIAEVVEAHTGHLLWFGALVALWTVTSFVETLRDLIHRAYGVKLQRGFIQYRLRSVGGTLLAMLLLVIAFLGQVVLVVAVKSVALLVPPSVKLPGWVDLSQWLPPLIVFLALWALFKLLAPHGYGAFPAWPGALVTTGVWILGSLVLGPYLARFGDMSLTYGALSGVMVSLLFFYAVGFATVLGAQLNAGLARRGAAR
jgi:membrane protein